MADLICSGESLLYRNAYFDSQSFGHGFGLGHDFRCQGARLWALHNLCERRAGERTDGVESHAAHELHPHLVADVASNWATQTRPDERLGDSAGAFAF